MSKSIETKTKKVENYLIKHKSITSWQAIEKFNHTRLASTIHKLKAKGWVINSKQMVGKDKDGLTSRFVKYVLISYPKKPSAV